MEDLKKYIKDALGIETEIKPLKTSRLKTLPMYIADEYSIQLMKIYRQDIVLVCVNNDFTTERLRKHLDTIRATFDTITVAVINQLESYKRLRLIEKKNPIYCAW